MIKLSSFGKKSSVMISINGENFWVHWVTNECVNIGYKGTLFGFKKRDILELLSYYNKFHFFLEIDDYKEILISDCGYTIDNEKIVNFKFIKSGLEHKFNHDINKCGLYIFFHLLLEYMEN